MLHSSLLLLLLLSLGYTVPTLAQADTILYVKPRENTKCPGEPCHTLSWYVKEVNNHENFHCKDFPYNDTVMKFLPGTHTLKEYFNFCQLSNLTMEATHPKMNETIISCSGIPGGDHTLYFFDGSQISIRGLSIINCVMPAFGHDSVLVFSNCAYVRISKVTIHLQNDQSGTGIQLDGVSENFILEEVEVTGLGGSSPFQYNAAVSVGHVDNITIQSCSFELAVVLNCENCGSDLAIIENVVFRNVIGTALDLEGNINVLLQNVTFVNNTFFQKTVVDASVVEIDNVQNVTFIDCGFYNNLVTPISADDGSPLHFSGNIVFWNNTGYNGGAMRFTGGSYVYISDNANVTFESNNAENAGGAVFVDQDTTYCFFRDSHHEPCDYTPCNIPFNLNFINNKAQNGGRTMYGAGMETCKYQDNPDHSGSDLLHPNSSLYFEPSYNSDPSQISSDPICVHLCESGTLDKGKIHCSINSLSETHYPGEEFTISAVDVDDMNGPVDGPVYAQFLPQYKESVMGELQHFQQVNHNCTELKYSVLSKPGLVGMALTLNTARILSHQQYGYQVYVNIILLPCPLGFILSEYPHQCICDKQLKRNNIPCNITTQTIQRSGTVWVNASFNGNISNGAIVHKNCPFGYCKTEVVHVNLSHPNTQCAFNHSGTLCGACQPGLSLALGSPQCLSHCSNSYISLLIAFATAGLVLVFFIKILDLTVAVGTINGLIVYANIVQAAQDTFLPAGDTNPLTVFIAWLNLDLGIESCFFDGLDGYWKTWLQFVFPFYIWAIILLIIHLSRCSQTVARIFGNNSVPVLATLILLSYTKLFRTIMSALTFTYLEFPDGSKTAVWSFDGNIQYLSPKHIPLFLFALGVFLFLWLPFTVLLLFEQCLQKVEIYTVRKWMLRLKPFFDAYFGPLRGNHRYWVGVLLVARGILLLVFGPFNPANDPSVNLLAVITVVLLLQMYISNLPHGRTDMDGGHSFKFWIGSCYKKWYLSLLETSFLCNLAILSAVTLAEGNRAAVVYTSVGIAFCQFFGIVVYHVYIIIRRSWEESRQGEVGGAQVNREDYELINEHNMRENWPLEAPYRRMDQCREPLLEPVEDD